MKKSEITQLTQIIEHIVAKEVRKQLPSIIAETFQNMMGKKVVTEERMPTANPEPINESLIEEEIPRTDFKASLRELFAGTPVMRAPQKTNLPKQYTKDPKLNQILNETVSDLRAREQMVGGAALMAGYSPSLNMIPGFDPAAASAPMAQEPEPEFMRNMPVMPGASSPTVMAPTGNPQMLAEGQVSDHAPLSSLPPGVSALDVKNHIPDKAVKGALTRNYSEMMKLIDRKQGKK